VAPLRIIDSSLSLGKLNSQNPDLSDPIVDTKSFNLPSSCESNSDCYNCTLANCNWSAAKCTNQPEQVKPLTVSQFLEKGA
jgi:hypothetical protein